MMRNMGGGGPTSLRHSIGIFRLLTVSTHYQQSDVDRMLVHKHEVSPGLPVGKRR
jgi:hypothetical protein